MKKFLLVLLAAAAVAYFYLPYHTTEKLEQALRTADKAELERLIDFPAVQQSIKDQLKAKLDSAITASKARGVPPAAGGIGSTVAGSMVDKLIDSMVTPEGLTNLLKINAKANAKTSFELREKAWVSPREFTARTEDRSILRFRFGSGGWRVVSMEMSEELAKASPGVGPTATTGG
jgi:hypothetical protein